MKKDVVFVSIKTKDRQPTESGYYHTKVGMHYFDKVDQTWYTADDKSYASDVKVWLESQIAYIFTETKLNEYTSDVIKKSLETAVDKASLEWIEHDHGQSLRLNKKSILNQFENIFKKFKIATL